MHPLKRCLAFCLCAFVCGYSLSQGLQWVAVVSLVLLLAVVYQNLTMRTVEVCLTLVARAQQAKVGSLEIQLDKKLADFSKKVAAESVWVQILVKDLSSEEVGTLLQISRVERFAARDGMKPLLRGLRARGLITHDQPKLTASHYVWVTDLGRELAQSLFGVGPDKPEAPNSDI